ncbi:hypothetical protein AU381_25325 [Sinorhizobium glycinis]|uniref:Uncharacterized protein n=1 Tax=Sinorhizobium glycinis TaxID=1472378 RepID=A0A178XIK9_9HYPH|nr:hypothetical protein AU381_25325 [Sinorhizobium glycinis]
MFRFFIMFIAADERQTNRTPLTLNDAPPPLYRLGRRLAFPQACARNQANDPVIQYPSQDLSESTLSESQVVEPLWRGRELGRRLSLIAVALLAGTPAWLAGPARSQRLVLGRGHRVTLASLLLRALSQWPTESVAG